VGGDSHAALGATANAVVVAEAEAAEEVVVEGE